MSDDAFMKRALELARDNLGNTGGKPSVGAVLTQKNEIVAEGVTQENGEHAEVNVLGKASGDTLYVTLEPCCHKGDTGPCTGAIINAGTKRVVIATQDQNPKVNGKGIQQLKEQGIEVTYGVLESEAKRLYVPFFHWITTGKPFVTVKAALTLDGSMTWGDEKRKWITGEEAKKHSHTLRKEHDAILVGSETVLKDDPELTTRYVKGKNPLKIVLDRRGRVPKEAKVYNEGDTLIWTDTISSLVEWLSEKNITSVLVEGGPTVIASFMNEGFANKLMLYVGSKKENGRGFFELLKKKPTILDMRVQQFGKDVLLEGVLG
ncbi:MAG: bifunctional diaminohydroxyphosphoribosylaminopyrimidine deaminase/5-amino-6-(5-phosphoribosylamino)uracil reductase RibD [Candidatus Woesearchaeota archaeon]|nr:bifunctional diaminohydroxyphosphoribosylaminopyrimidine deaminase/5-amino-6-(5-phosphoribosylamino)uracil reductase RibD [Candidatus Woesearchaeota archaeon]